MFGCKVEVGLVELNRPEICRHFETLQCNSDGGVYEWETISISIRSKSSSVM
jgi:hypothetical protein